MSRIGDLLRGMFTADTGLVPPPVLTPDYELGPNTPIPGPHVHPSLDQADTERQPPYGATGTINYKGYLQPSEYNVDLQRFAALDVYERMRRSDPSIRETLWTIKQPIVNAEWTIEPPDDPTDDEREQAEFVRAALFEWLEQPWTELLEHALTYLDFGHAVHETVFQVVTRSLTVRGPAEGGADDAQPEPSDGADTTATEGDEGEIAASELPTATKTVVSIPVPMPPDTDTKVLPPRQFTTWRKFSPRLPRTIWKWNHDEYGELESITQTVWVNMPDGSQGFRIIEIPAENLVTYTHEKWGDEWTGISLLRSAYKPWIMKELIEKIAGIAYERHGVGYLVAYLPRERAEDQTLQAKLGSMLQNLRQDAWAVIPGPKQMSGSTGPQGYLVEVLTPPGGIPSFEPILTYYRGEIAGAMLTRFKELGHAATGARATADVQAAVWYSALHAIARYIEAMFNVAIRRLVDLNYPNVKRYPKLKAAGIESRNLLEFAQSVALLTDAEMLSPDLKTRQWTRANIDAPAEDLAETRARMLYEAQQQKAQADMQHEQAMQQINAKSDGKQTPTDHAKAAARPRGNETDSGANPGRSRTGQT